jgi:transposase
LRRGDPGQRSGPGRRRGTYQKDPPPVPLRQARLADGGYSGDNLATDLAAQQVTLKIVKRMDKKGGFKVIRRRWVVERTFSRLRRNRRLMAHYEAIAIIAEGFAKLAMISVTLKRLTEPRPKPAS